MGSGSPEILSRPSSTERRVNKLEILVGYYNDANIQATPASPIEFGSVNVGSPSAAQTHPYQHRRRL
jgi:hypothetical protein